MERTPASRPARRQDPVLLAAGAVLLAAAAVFAVVMAADRARPPTASLDRWWLSVVTTWQSVPLTRAGEVLSYVAGPWGGTVVVAVLVVSLLWRRRFGAAVFLALAEACGSGASQLIKHLVRRPRPPHPLVRADFGSFPSGHVITTVVVGLAVVAALSRPGRRKLPLAGVAAAAVLMMCCRTYLRAHWLSDTFESVLVASGLVLVLWALFTPVLHATSVTSALVNPGIPGLSPKVATKEDIMASGFTACPEYQAAILGFYRKHVCRLDPWPPGLERSYAEAGFGVYTTMNGPSEFTVTGTLKTWDIMDRLPEITVPALLVGGRYDECTPGHMADMHARIAGSELVTIEDASHLCFAEQPAEFNRVINGFLDRTEHGPRS